MMLPQQLQCADILSIVGIIRQCPVPITVSNVPNRNETEQNVVLEQELKVVPETKLCDGGILV